MTPEQWQEVKKVLAGALECTPEKRQAYLDEAGVEPSLRREVESLIAAHEQSDSSFLERPAAAGGVLKSGTKLGPYEILAPLGAGGMGEVYRARDTRLEREVAVKVLSPGLLADEAARRRFRNEALALAKLNHPNIGGIHEFERQDHLDFASLPSPMPGCNRKPVRGASHCLLSTAVTAVPGSVLMILTSLPFSTMTRSIVLTLPRSSTSVMDPLQSSSTM